MSQNRRHRSILPASKVSPPLGGILALTTAAFVLAGSLQASTVTYLRFEEGVDGGFLTGNNGNADPHSVALDSSGNGNDFRTYNAPVSFDTSPRYTTNVPGATVPQTGAANNLSFDFISNDDIYNDTLGSLRTVAFTDFTIEAYVQFDTLGGFQTFIGRDDTGNPGEVAGGTSLFYFQKSNAQLFRFEAIDSLGVSHAVAGTTAVSTGVWYHVAVVGDSATDLATLYVNGVAEGSVAFTDGLYNPAADTIWTVGRGQFNGGTGDFVDGRIDEVRWSDSALPASALLVSTPEPTGLSLLALGGIALVGRRRRQR